MAGANFPVVIFHNPECGTSPNVLAIIMAAGYSPTIIDYMIEGWTRGQLLALFAAADVTPREALREKNTPAKDLGLINNSVGEEALIESMIEHPILVNRPFVATPKGVKLCRPDSGMVLDLLQRWPNGPFAKEDGVLLIDADGNRVRE